MQIGIGSFAFAWAIGVAGYTPERPLTASALLTIAADFEADCVQLADNMALHEFLPADLDHLKAKARELRLDLEVGMRGMTISSGENYLAIAARLGSKLLRVVIDKADYRPSINEICSTIHHLLPHCKQKGIRLAIENHDRFSSQELMEIIERTDPVWIGICLDSVNSLGRGEGFQEVFEKLSPYTINVHIKDYLIKRKHHQMGFDVLGAVAGEGMLPIAHVLEQLKLLGKCQSAILESWPSWEENLETTIEKEKQWAEKGMSFLRKTHLKVMESQ